ncbi:MAG: copper resistance protein CopC [Acetobacteraceae bacterium]|nr:copper resistance protein CopC [Acetobacteraceae bacterium]
MSRLFASALLVLSVALPIGVARAHAMLERAEPAVGAVVAVSPAALVLHFSETLEPAFAQVGVADAGGGSVTAGPPSPAPEDGRVLRVPLKPLPPGDYTVTWSVVSTDTHRTQGRFTFRVEH